jgi:hypothetical protein
MRKYSGVFYDGVQLCGNDGEINHDFSCYKEAAPKIKEASGTSTNTGSRETAPIVVCLCGSTRFSEAFREANFQETLSGNIVLSIGCDTKSDKGLGLTVADKKRLDWLHLRKIDLANEVLILNVGGYIGNSTRRELNYAIAQGKNVRYLEPLRAGA